ncbi:MAG: ArsA family ATPase [Bradymonadia bacterium]
MSFLNRRALLITGKGGVGRTSVATALGMGCARSGRRTLVLEVAYDDISESALGARFGFRDLNEAEKLVSPNLWIGRLNASAGHALFLRTILPSKTLINAALRSRAVSKFLMAAPSLHEMGVFYHLLTLLKRKRADGEDAYESIIIDMPATGHTLALTGLPTILGRLIPKGPIAKAMEEGQAILNNPALCAAWIVTLPEKLPVTEALELKQGLEDTQVPVGGIILNRMPTYDLDDVELRMLKDHLDAQETFGALSVSRAQAAHDVVDSIKVSAALPLMVFPELPGDDHVVAAMAAHATRLIEGTA